MIVGTLGRSPVIDRLVRERKLDATGVAGAWEGYLHQVVIAYAGHSPRACYSGADKRGTIFGAYHLSEQIGVSPWHYWADAAGFSARRPASGRAGP